jgi:hypothetical protein
MPRHNAVVRTCGCIPVGNRVLDISPPHVSTQVDDECCGACCACCGGYARTSAKLEDLAWLEMRAGGHSVERLFLAALAWAATAYLFTVQRDISLALGDLLGVSDAAPPAPGQPREVLDHGAVAGLAIGISSPLFLVYLLYFLCPGPGAMAAGGTTSDTPHLSVAVSQSEVQGAAAELAGAWAEAKGYAGGARVDKSVLAVAAGEVEAAADVYDVEGRGGAGGGDGLGATSPAFARPPLFETYKRAFQLGLPRGSDRVTLYDTGVMSFKSVRGCCNVSALSNVTRQVTSVQDAVYLLRTRGGRSLPALLCIAALVALLAWAPWEPPAGRAGGAKGGATIALAVVTGLLLATAWFLAPASTLTVGMPGKTLTARVPTVEADTAMLEAAFSATLRRPVSLAAPAAATISLSGTDSRGRLIDLAVGFDVTFVRISTARNVVTKAVCGLCAGTLEYMVATRDLTTATSGRESVWPVTRRMFRRAFIAYAVWAVVWILLGQTLGMFRVLGDAARGADGGGGRDGPPLSPGARLLRDTGWEYVPIALAFYIGMSAFITCCRRRSFLALGVPIAAEDIAGLHDPALAALRCGRGACCAGGGVAAAAGGTTMLTVNFNPLAQDARLLADRVLAVVGVARATPDGPLETFALAARAAVGGPGGGGTSASVASYGGTGGSLNGAHAVVNVFHVATANANAAGGGAGAVAVQLPAYAAGAPVALASGGSGEGDPTTAGLPGAVSAYQPYASPSAPPVAPPAVPNRTDRVSWMGAPKSEV